MSAVARNTQLRAAAFAYENAYPYDDVAEARAERADELRGGLKAVPSFIGEAIGNADLTELVAAFLSKDAQHCWDAISDLLDEYAKNEERRCTGRHDDGLTAMTKLAAEHGVFA